MKKAKILVIMGLCIGVLCGCQKTPETTLVTSKNDERLNLQLRIRKQETRMST